MSDIRDVLNKTDKEKAEVYWNTILAKNKYINELLAKIDRLETKIDNDRQYQMKQTFH